MSGLTDGHKARTRRTRRRWWLGRKKRNNQNK